MYINVLALFGGGTSSSIFSVWKAKDMLVDANFTCYTKLICAAVVGAREAFKKKRKKRKVFLFYIYAIFFALQLCRPVQTVHNHRTTCKINSIMHYQRCFVTRFPLH